jgi:putative membrane protein
MDRQHHRLSFGTYHYTDALAPLVGGVPAAIPVAWLMMLPPAWAVAYAATGQARGWRFVFVSGLAFTTWDLFLNPQMVAWGLLGLGNPRPLLWHPPASTVQAGCWHPGC